jgi:serine protease Do
MAAAHVSFADSPDDFSQSVIKKAFDTVSPALVLLEYSLEITNAQTGEVSMREANSTGVVVSADGLILSQGHMMLENRRPMNVKASFPGESSQKKYDAVLLHKPEDINISFLRITSPPDELPHVTFSEGGALSIGEPLLLIGLLRETLDFTHGIQTRRVGALLNEPRRTYALDDAVPFGFVGGPVADASGNVIGLTGFDLSTQEGGELYTRSGHPLVYQTALFKKYIDAPPGEETAGGREDAWLGVYTQPLTDDFAEYWNLPKNGGLIVSTVIAGSPADRAGLRMGDVITSFNGRTMTAKQDPDVLNFTKLVRESPLNEPLPLTLIRGGETMDIRLTLLPRPKSGREAQEIEDETFGLTIRELTTDVRIALSLPEEVEGVIVRRVRSGSPAALGGLRPGFVILSVGGRPVGSLAAFTAAVEAEKQTRNSEVSFFCRVGANTAFFRIQPRW